MRINTFLVALAVIFGAVFTVSAHETAPANTVYIHLTDNGFEPDTVTINVGDTVIFENLDTEFRWPASNIHPTHEIYPEFDPGLPLAEGEEWAFTFTRAGSWRMHDHLLPEFTGEITAQGLSEVLETKKINPFVRLVRDIRLFFTRTYYSFFPDKLEEKFGEVSFLAVAREEEELVPWLELVGAKRVMEALIKETDGGARVDCHSEAHYIGRSAYELYGASVYTDGDASCHSGFYHGVMEAFISEKGTKDLAHNIESLCDSLETNFDIFECYHGVGHGVMAYEDYDVPKSLEMCGELTSDYNKGSCYGGVFMENVVAGQGSGALTGHETKWLKRDDPLFPCNDVGDEYSVLWNCYVMQTSWMLYITDYDFPKVAEQCRLSRPDMISTCYASFGRDSAGHNLRDPEKTLASCALVPDERDYRERCIIGALYVILDFWGSGLQQQGEEFCALVPVAERGVCSETVELRKQDLGLL